MSVSGTAISPVVARASAQGCASRDARPAVPAPPRGAVPKIRVFLEASDPLSRAGISAFLTGRSGMLELSTGRPAEADLVVMAESEMTAGVMARLRDISPAPGQLRIVMVLDRLGDCDLIAAVELGVVGVVYRSQATVDHLVRVLLAVHQGGTYLPPDVQSRLVTDIARMQRDVLAPRGLTASGLQAREVAVLRFLSEGLETAEIARRMQYSERTVKSILYSLMDRLQLRNRPHAVAYAMRAGVV